MAGGSVGALHALGRQGGAPAGPAAVTPQSVYQAPAADPNSSQGMAQARTFADGGIAGLMGQGNPVPQFNTQSGYNNYAAPSSSGFMQYPQQGQSNQPQQGAFPSAVSGNIPPVQNDGGPDSGGNYAPTSMGFDNSGSDAGVGGQPVTQVQTPLQSSSGQPQSLSNYMSPQGLQIQGNPTSQAFNRGSRS